MRTRRRVSAQTQAERLVLGYIRAAAAGDRQQDDPAFSELAENARSFGLVILPVTAPYLSDGEIALLGYIAEYQRQLGSTARVPHDTRRSLYRCAKLLEERALKLPYLAIQRACFGSFEIPSSNVPPRTLDIELAVRTI